MVDIGVEGESEPRWDERVSRMQNMEILDLRRVASVLGFDVGELLDEVRVEVTGEDMAKRGV